MLCASRLLMLSVGLVVTLAAPACWATDVATYRKFGEAAQVAYVAGVVDTLMSRAIVEIMAKNPNTTMSEVRQSPFVGCIMRTSYGTFLSATQDFLSTEALKDDDPMSLVVVRAASKICPP